jgi:hypothetical protein
MGWSNYIIIPKLKLIVEVSRNIYEIPEHQKKSLDYLTDEERLFEQEEYGVENKNIKSISLKDITLLFNIYGYANNISGMNPDKFFLYWLESKNIKYEILSEFEISDKLEEYKKTYTILRLFEHEE